MQRIKLLFRCSLLLLLAGILAYSYFPEKNPASTVLFWLSVVIALVCNMHMAKAKMVGKSSPYIFVITALTVLGFFPMLALMGYIIKKASVSNSQLNIDASRPSTRPLEQHQFKHEELKLDITAAESEIAEIDVLMKDFKELDRDEFMRLHNRRSELGKFVSDYEYQSLTFDGRVEWWMAAIYRSMRMQAENGSDQLLLFDKKWHEHAEKKEPKIVDVLRIVCDRLQIQFDIIQRLIEHDAGTEEWKAIRENAPKADFV